MKKHTFFSCLAAAFFILLISCSKEEGDELTCGDENIAGFGIYTISDFNLYQPGLSAGNATFSSYYSTSGSLSYIGLTLILSHVCRHDLPFVSAELDLITPNPDIHDTLAINYTDAPSLLKFEVPKYADDYYLFGEAITLGGESNDIQINMTSSVGFPAQGSWPADSAYFFGNLTKLYIAITAKKPA